MASIRDKYAIVGIGDVMYGKERTFKSSMTLGLEAAARAIEDAGLRPSEIDGVLSQSPRLAEIYCRAVYTAQQLGITPLHYAADMLVAGATHIAMAHAAVGAIETGMAETVLCVYGEAGLSGDGGFRRGSGYGRYDEFQSVYGRIGPIGDYALAARRHMHTYGTTSEHLGAVAVTTRYHASLNPEATMREPITLEDHQKSRWVVEPFHLLDTCLLTDAGGAFIVTSAERARDLKQKPIYIMGMGQAHLHRDLWESPTGLLQSPAAVSGPRAYRMAGIGSDDVDVAELYDCFTYVSLVQVEDYGFCPKGEGGPFIADGNTRLGGKIPVNTHGGMLSYGYIQGIEHLLEAVKQLRGDCGARQVPGAEIALASGSGCTIGAHSTIILRR